MNKNYKQNKQTKQKSLFHQPIMLFIMDIIKSQVKRYL